ncbi:DNA polymerase III subunit delta [Mycoplasmopsis alligatoris]|uniref:DNA polymerase III subunit delta n=1 Tax=Mycoplasmopsis alligatoris A21JP2 TaxID=747682 RepID=D4XVX3_9BACT|nr:DNA polymerase III subunit delta [Mycoplasmopsis alligatoris]EFF41500.1 DNA polymerase III, delta subunit [Mycoplasmopsis alligatoris A21JP2]
MIFISGKEQYFINSEINKVKKMFEAQNIFKYEDNFDLNLATLEMSSISIFSEKKLFIFPNFYLFMKKDKDINFNEKKFISYLTNDSFNEYIFTFSEEKIINNPFTNLVLKNSLHKEALSFTPSDYPKVIKKIVTENKGEISILDALYLAQKLPNNLELIICEIKKLLSQSLNITKEIIDLSVGDYGLDDQYSFINSIATRNFSLIYKKYTERKRSGDTILSLIGQLSSFVCLTHRIVMFKKAKLSANEIIETLKLNKIRYRKAEEFLVQYGQSKVLKIIKDLEKLDLDIKRTGVNDEQAFETFLIREFAK